MFIDTLTMCTDTVSTLWGVFAPDIAPNLLYYSYIPIAVTALLIGATIAAKDTYSLRSKLLFTITILFAVSILNEIFLWIALPVEFVYFGWALVPLLRLLLILTTIYFANEFLNKQPFTFKFNLLLFILSLPVILLLPTTLNIHSFELHNCEAVSGPLISYVYFLAILGVCWLTYTWVKNKRTKVGFSQTELRANATITLASSLFLLFLAFSESLAIFADNYAINLIGPFGMLLFLGILSYAMVQFKLFNTGIIATEALVTTLVLIIGSMLFFSRSTVNLILIAISLVLVTIGGSFLIKSVRSEVRQKEQITKLALDLQNANLRLKDLDKMKTEFVSIASHQLRSPLTSIRGYTSMLMEGSYGKLPVKAQEVISKIADSSKYMALSIEDYLNVSRIEAGNMKYEMSDFNARDLVEKIVDEMRPVAIKKGLVMVFRSDCNGSCMIHADIGKTRQIVMNLLDNSMKYTPKGSITVVVHDDVKKKILSITVQDTGVGMSAETMETLFEKFVRAKNANCVNVTGTGLGLYVAKKMVTEMGAKIWMESEGEGKGSTFHVEFALLPGKSKVLK